MLKFTKYGRKSCSGSFAVNSLTDSNSKGTDHVDDGTVDNIVGEPHPHKNETESSVRLSNYRGYSRKDEASMKKPEFYKTKGTGARATFGSGSNLSPPLLSSDLPAEVIPLTKTNVHLRISKITQEELRRLDSEIQPNQEKVRLGKAGSFTSSTLDLFKMKKRHSPKTKSSVSISVGNGSIRGNVDKVKVPVFQDGYFPRVQPFSKIFFAKKRTS